MSPGERLQNARLPVSSTKRKNPEGVAEASASAQVSHRRVMQLVVPIEQMIFEAGAGDDARTGKILAELQKSLAIGRNPDLGPDPNRLGGHLLVGHHCEA